MQTVTPEETVHLLGLRVRNNGECWGSLDGTPVIFRVLTSTPLSFLFKVRLASNMGTDYTLPWDLQSIVAEDKGSFELYNGYAWFSVDDVMPFGSSAEVVGVYKRLVRSLQEAELAAGVACLQCGRKDALRLICDYSEVGYLCVECCTARLAERRGREAELNRKSNSYLVLVPFAAALIPIFWGMLWYGYDWAFRTIGVERVWLPQFLAVLIVIAITLLPVLPCAYAVKRSTLSKFIPDSVSLPILFLIGAILGEVVCIALILWSQTHQVMILSAFRLLPEFVSNYTDFGIFMKGGMAIGYIFLGIHFGKPERASMDLK